MTTIEVPEDVLESVVRVAHAATPQEAVLKALKEFAEKHDQSKLIPLMGTSDGFMTLEELEEMRAMD
jgi:hypothetical protein